MGDVAQTELSRSLTPTGPTPGVRGESSSEASRQADQGPVRATDLLEKGIETKGQRMDYIECADDSNVRLTIEQVRSLSPILVKRRKEIEKLIARGSTIRDPLEDNIRFSSAKWEAWGNYINDVEAGKSPSETPELLSKADLDIAYYVVFDEILQRGVFLDREVHYEQIPQGCLRSVWNFFRGYEPPIEPVVRPESPSILRQTGFTSEYMRSVYRDTQDSEKIGRDLINLEETRRGLIRALTGRELDDEVMDRMNWQSTIHSLFARNNMGFKLHNEIITQLEGNNTYTDLLERYRGRNVNIQNITDLLISIDNPHDRLLAIRAYHEALNAAAGQMTTREGSDFVSCHIDQREKAWGKDRLVERAESKRKILEEHEDLSPEQRSQIEQFREGLENVRVFLEGGEINGQTITGLTIRLDAVVSAVIDYRSFSNIPRNDMAPVEAVITAQEDIIRRINNYQQGVANARVNLPPDLRDVLDEIDRVENDMNNPPATYNQDQQIEYIANKDRLLTLLKEDFPNKIDTALKTAQDQKNRLEARRSKLEEEYDQRVKAIKNATEFIETEMPVLFTDFQQIYDKLDDVVNNSGSYPYLTPAQVVQIRNHRDHIGAVRDYIRDNIYNPLRRLPGEDNAQYVNRPDVRDFQLNSNDFLAMLLIVRKDVESYDDILQGRVDEDTQARIDANDLIVALVKGLDARGEGDRERPAVEGPLLEKTKDKLFNEMMARDQKYLERLYNHDISAIRDLLFDHPELDSHPALRDQNLRRRVLSDVFILQSAIEYYRELDIPSPTAGRPLGFYLANENDSFRHTVIRKMADSPIRLSNFLTYLVEKRLSCVASSFETNTEIVEVQISDTGNYRYDVVNRSGPAAGVFSVENNTRFYERMQMDRSLRRRINTEGLRIENMAKARSFEVDNGQGITIDASGNNAILLNCPNAAGQFADRELGVRFHISRIPTGGRISMQIQAHPSLEGINIPGFGAPAVHDRRWVELPMANFNTLADINTYIANQIQGLRPVDYNNIRNSILRTIGDNFLGYLPADRMAEFPKFGEIDIPQANYAVLYNAGYRKIAMDVSGEIELTRADNTKVSVLSAIASRGPNPPRLNSLQIDQIFRIVGRQVLEILGQ